MEDENGQSERTTEGTGESAISYRVNLDHTPKVHVSTLLAQQASVF